MPKSKENKDKKRSKKLALEERVADPVKDGIRHTILGIVFLGLAIFLFLSSRELAGSIGRGTYNVLHYLLGTGFYLVPAISALVSFSFFRSGAPRIVYVRLIGSLLFILSGLGLIERGFGTTHVGAGGKIGWVIAAAADKLLGTASWVAFTALFIISLVLILETSFSFENIRAWWQRRKESRELPADGDESDEDEVALVARAPQEVASAEAEAEPVPATAGFLSLAKKSPVAEKHEEFVPLMRADRKPYVAPSLDLLGRDSGKPGAGDIKANSNIIKRTLSNFGIEVEMDEISIGPSITRYALKPAEGVKLSRIIALQNDLSLALAAHPLRVEAPIPGKSLVGIEVPNTVKTTVRLGSLLEDSAFQNAEKPLLVALGKDISGSASFADLAKMPHALIAGTTGSGKSVTIHAIIMSLLFRNAPENLRFIMIDPKRVELTLYNKIPHLLTPVITNPKKAILALKWAAKEMDRRYDILEAESARDIKSYHENIYRPALDAYNKKVAKGASDEEKAELGAKLPEPMPYMVIVIDELADIMTSYPRELESAIVRIAQMSRAVGIHLMLSTQRPSTEVITGLIKANVPTRVALQVPSQIDSRTIIDMPGAEKLLGAGDMLYLSAENSKPIRLQSAFVSEGEVKKVVQFITGNNDSGEVTPDLDIAGVEPSGGGISSGPGDFGDDAAMGDDDDMYEEARDTVQKMGKASSSLLQRKLKVGYARAARLLDILEERGIVGPGSGAKPREVYGATGGSGGGTATDEFGAEFDASLAAKEETEGAVEPAGPGERL